MTAKPEKIEHSHPLDDALCIFRMKDSNLFIGYMDSTFLQKVKVYSKAEYIDIAQLNTYQYILNEKGGLIFVNK